MKRIFKSVIALSAALCVVFTMSAQNGTVSGLITDAETGEPLLGVNVQMVEDGSVGGATDIDGKYSISVPAGQMELKITYVGYEKLQSTVNVEAGRTVIFNIQLSPASKLMDQVVISGSKFEKKISEEAVSMVVVTPEQIENINAVKIDDAIARVPGVNVLDGQVNVRGGAGYSYGAGTRVLLLYNDMPILQADAGFPNWTAIPLENIGQVELIKGAASSLYGSSAINGVINLRSAEPLSKPYFKVSTFGTLYGIPANNPDSTGENKAWWQDSADAQIPHEAGLSVAYRQKFGQLDITAGGYFFKSESFRQGEFDNRGRLNLLTRYRFKNIDGLSVGLNINSQVGESASLFIWNGTGAQAYQNWTPPTRTDAVRLTIDPFLNYFDSRGNRHRLQLRYNQVDNDNTNNQGNFSKQYYGEYQYQRIFDDIDFTITAGGVASYNTVQADLYADSVRVEGDWKLVGDPLDGRNTAAFVQLEKKFFGKLNIIGGARLEANAISFTDPEQKVVFRAGANFEAAEYTFLRASWGQGYRFPTIAEKFIETQTGIISILPNPDLISETGWNAEIGLNQGLAFGSFEASFDLAFFYQEYTDMMEFTLIQTQLGLPAFQSQNIGDTRIYGTDVSIRGRGKIGEKTAYQLGAGYVYLVPEYQDFTDEIRENSSCDENVLTYRNEHTFKGDFDLTSGIFNIGTSFQYYSFMRCIDNVFEVLLPGVADFRNANNNGDWIFDIRAGVNIGEHLTISGLVRNVANREYALRPARMEAPRNYTIRVDYTIGK